jgi:hypothetical protein
VNQSAESISTMDWSKRDAVTSLTSSRRLWVPTLRTDTENKAIYRWNLTLAPHRHRATRHGNEARFAVVKASNTRFCGSCRRLRHRAGPFSHCGRAGSGGLEWRPACDGGRAASARPRASYRARASNSAVDIADSPSRASCSRVSGSESIV